MLVIIMYVHPVYLDVMDSSWCVCELLNSYYYESHWGMKFLDACIYIAYFYFDKQVIHNNGTHWNLSWSLYICSKERLN